MMMNDDDRTVFVNIDKVMPEMSAPIETMTEQELSKEVEAVMADNKAAGNRAAAGNSAVAAEKEADSDAAQLEELYRKLGKAYYEGGFEDPLPELLPLFDEITGLRNKMEEKIASQKIKPKQNICPGCGIELEEDAKFCGNCGCRVG